MTKKLMTETIILKQYHNTTLKTTIKDIVPTGCVLLCSSTVHVLPMQSLSVVDLWLKQNSQILVSSA